jgi:hypothetical protein
MKQGMFLRASANAVAARPTHFAGTACLFLVSHWVGAAAVTIDPSQAIVLVESSHNPMKDTETIRSAVALPGGGIFATGVRDKEHLWSLKVAADGSLAWKTIYSDPKLENAFVAGVLPDGGYWVAGVATAPELSKDTDNPHGPQRLQALQFDFLRRFDANGSASEILPVSPVGENHFLSCGVAVPEGYVLTGSTSSGEQFRNQLSPWMELIDRTGKRIWERSFIDVQNRLIKSTYDRKCGGLQVTADGRITYAASVMTNHIIESVQETNLGVAKLRVAEFSPASNGFRGTLLVQLDMQGNVISQSFRQEMVDAHLVKGKKGLVLLEHYVHQDQNPPRDMLFPDTYKWVPGVDYGLRMTSFDGVFTPHTQAFTPDEWSSLTEDAYATPEGGWLFASCKGNQGEGFLQYMNSAGVLSSRQMLHSNGVNPCDRLKIGAGTKPGEAVLITNNRWSGTLITRVEYSE